MTFGMRKYGWLWGLGAAAMLVIAYAWSDGGLRPLHEISQPVAVPEMPR